MRLLICAGGTGGGVYPALAVLSALRQSAENAAQEGEGRGGEPGGSALSCLWVGGIGGMESELVKRAEIPFTTIPAAGVHGVSVRQLPGNAWQLLRGYRQSQRILRQFRPEALFFTGGYLAVPMALAGRRIPTALYVPDIEPGLALKTLARFAERIAVTAEDSRAYFPGHGGVVVTGYPTRPDLKAWSMEAAWKVFDLAPGLPTLLVFGGSKGARSINRALLVALPELLSEAQVIHISGQLDWQEVETRQRSLSPEQAARYRPYPYLHAEMGAAYAVADLALSRAGASTLGEFPLFGLPAVLVPYPYAWRYQRVNAEYLVRRGAAVMVKDEDLPAQLLPVVRGLLRDPASRSAMRSAMQSLARPDAAGAIAETIRSLAASSRQGRI